MLFIFFLAISSCFAQNQKTTFRLLDHPYGGYRPPTYCLRMDRLFAGEEGAQGQVTSFSCEAENSEVYLDVIKNERRNWLNVTIRGRMYGGEDVGEDWGYGKNHYRIHYEYDYGVTEQGNGWVATTGLGNKGFIRRGNPDRNGFYRDIYSKNMNPAFLFLADGHRLQGQGNEWVGRGWHTYNENHGADSGTKDFIFVGEPIIATRDRCWWRKHTCHFEGLLPLNIGERTLNNNHQVMRYLSHDQEGDIKWELTERLVVFYLNMVVFGAENGQYHRKSFSVIYGEALDAISNGNRAEREDYIKLLDEIIAAGSKLPISETDFGPCPQDCTCFCQDRWI